MREEERSPEARARAEQALVSLLSGLDGTDLRLIVLGGLVPAVLTRGREVAAPEHLGTTDVDILLITQVSRGENLAAIERSLRLLDFAPEERGWRWRGRVDGRGVKIEFLCDIDTERQGALISPTGCQELRANNLRGTGYVALDWHWEEITGVGVDGEPLVTRVRFAGLNGYLLSKCVALHSRAAEKDYYDLPYVLIHNRAGGPREAAESILAGELSTAIHDIETTLRELRARYHTPTDFAPRCYASQMRLIDPELDELTLRADAVVAVAEFVDTLMPSASE